MSPRVCGKAAYAGVACPAQSDARLRGGGKLKIILRIGITAGILVAHCSCRAMLLIRFF